MDTLETDQVDRIDEWLRSVLWENELPNDAASHDVPFEIHRLKGRIILQNGSIKMIQGVRELFEIFDSPQCETAQGGASGKIILIGRGLKGFDFRSSLLKSLGQA